MFYVLFSTIVGKKNNCRTEPVNLHCGREYMPVQIMGIRSSRTSFVRALLLRYFSINRFFFMFSGTRSSCEYLGHAVHRVGNKKHVRM